MGCRRPAVALLLGALLAAGAPSAAAAPTGTVSGKLQGANVPPPARGGVVLRALRLDRGTVEATRRVGRSGAYRLQLEPGPYAVLGTVVDRAATAAVVTRGPLLTLRAGQRRAVPVKLRKAKPRKAARRKRKRARRPKAAAAYVHEDGTETPGVVAYQVLDLTGATGELAVFNRGLADLLMTDTFGRGGCASVQVAGPRDQAAIAEELDLQASPYADPGTRVTRNFVLPDVVVRGRLANRPGALAYVITVADARTGALRGTLDGELRLTDRLSAQTGALGARIMEIVCRPAAPPPPAPPVPPGEPTPPPPSPPAPPAAVDPAGLTGTFSGEVDLRTQPLTPIPLRLTWSGTLDLVRDEYGFAPFVVHRLRAGSVTATMDHVGEGGACDWDGTSTIDLVEANAGQPASVLTVDLIGEQPLYRVTVGAPLGRIDGVKSGCEDDPSQNGQPVSWPLAGTPLAWTLEPRPVASRFAFTGSETGRPGPADPVHHWSWTLTGG